MYTGHGLDAYKDIPWHMNNIAHEYVGNNDAAKAYATAGFFTLPVCELKGWNWKQSDNMHKSPPCDCCKFPFVSCSGGERWRDGEMEEMC